MLRPCRLRQQGLGEGKTDLRTSNRDAGAWSSGAGRRSRQPAGGARVRAVCPCSARVPVPGGACREQQIKTPRQAGTGKGPWGKGSFVFACVPRCFPCFLDKGFLILHWALHIAEVETGEVSHRPRGSAHGGGGVTRFRAALRARRILTPPCDPGQAHPEPV